MGGVILGSDASSNRDSLRNPVQAARLPSLLRATRVAAAAPNSRIIGGAGTCVPPLDVEECPPLEELEDEEEELALLAELLEVEPEEPKLLEPPVAPELEALLADEDDALLAEEALLPEPPEEP